MSRLPIDVITDIFSRLPIKSLLRFRSLSKSFCSLIDSPDFAKLHLNRIIKSNSNLSLIIEDIVVDGSTYSVDLDSSDTQLVKFDPIIEIPEASIDPAQYYFTLKKFGNLFGSCNGLIAFCYEEGIFLQNPTLKNHLKLENFPGNYSDSEISLDGFGYNSVTDDYKIVRISLKNGKFSGVIVHNLKSNSSRIIDEDFPYFFNEDRDNVYDKRCGVLFGNSLHWLISHNQDNCMNVYAIVAFDLDDESFRIVPLPDYILNEAEVISGLGVLDGCLSIGINIDFGFEIWVMKEYGVKESWSKLLYVDKADLGLQDYLPAAVKPIWYSKSDNKVLIETNDFWFSWYNLEDQSYEKLGFSDQMRGSAYPIICVKSLLRPNFVVGTT